MVRHTGLKLRMVLAGSILFGFYALLMGLVVLYFGATTPVLAGAVLLTLGFVVFQYKVGTWGALRSVGAEEMPETGEYRDIHRAVERLADDMGIEKPRLMVAEMGMPNAFAIGRKADGTVVVSEEIIELLEFDELEGVLAHELAHIKNRDVVIMTLGQSLASIVGIVVQFAVIFANDEGGFGNIILGMILGNLAQLLVMVFVFAISRYREYVADGDAAEYTGNPDAMARALEKIQQGAKQAQQQTQTRQRSRSRGRGRGRRERQPQAGANQGGAGDVAALCIFGGDRGLLQSIFSTHPPVEKRIQRLRS
jgi:heat shock protein HtpX